MAYLWDCLPCGNTLLGMREGLGTSEAKCRKCEPGRVLSGLRSFCEPDVWLHLELKASAPSFRRILWKTKKSTPVAGKSHSPFHTAVMPTCSRWDPHNHLRRSSTLISWMKNLKCQEVTRLTSKLRGGEKGCGSPHFSSRNLLDSLEAMPVCRVLDSAVERVECSVRQLVERLQSSSWWGAYNVRGQHKLLHGACDG